MVGRGDFGSTSLGGGQVVRWEGPGGRPEVVFSLRLGMEGVELG